MAKIAEVDGSRSTRRYANLLTGKLTESEVIIESHTCRQIC